MMSFLRMVTALLALSCLGLAPPPPRRTVPLPGLTARPLGPAVMGGRLTCVAAVERDPTTHYVGAAAGGLWKTSDDGRTWACVFEGRPNASIGAIALAPSRPEVVWVGTGEANLRNSVSWGNGVFVSRDAGKTWAHVGLEATRHIGRIVVHPKDPDTAYVAALGRAWGPSPERGVYRTRDGGRTWEHVLRLDDDTGCVDLAMRPDDPQVLFAAAYRVRRGPFSGGNPKEEFGPKAGIYRTRDGGRTWQRLSKGLPTRSMGRVGLDVYRADPRVVFAVVQTDRTDLKQLPGQPPGGPGSVETGGVFRSGDGGDTWRKLNDLCPRPFYFGQVRVDPTNDKRVWVLGVPLFASRDGGRTFQNNGAPKVHVDHHDLWIDPLRPARMLLANDGGLAASRNGGATWVQARNLPVSQFYGVAVDLRSPYRIYGGLQDNGSWGGPSRSANPAGVLNGDWFRVLGLDGFQCACPPDDPLTVYVEGQYGRLHRVDLRNRQATAITPRPVPGEVFRFNWSTPLLLSPRDGKTLFYAGNHLFRSTDRGQTWAILGPDLTAGRGDTAYRDRGHTLTAVAESPLRKGLLYVGSDDGRAHVSRDGGATWGEMTLPLDGGRKGYTVSRIECSPHAAATAWLALSRHRLDDEAPYLFRTDDAGRTWRPALGDLPAGEGPIHVVRASGALPGLLFVGTEHGLHLSLDDGRTWQRFPGGLPRAPVHDLVIHPRERELVVATHGRGLYAIDLSGLEQLTPRARSARVHLAGVRDVALARPAPLERPGPGAFAAPNPPEGAAVWYWLGEKASGVRLEVLSSQGEVIARLDVPATEAGLQVAHWGLWRELPTGRRVRVGPGEYTVRLRAAGEERTTKVRVRP